jgi:energy-converting hydrogenase B subunit D
MNWVEILTIGLSVILIISAVFAVVQKDLILAVIGASAVSVALSALYFILQAPDVALTEAAIGVALTTIIFVITIKKTKRYEE